MFRGAIDHTTQTTISGWLFSAVGSVRGQQVMAFVDGICVGAGRVDRFRKDLLDAGLGDGYLGFSFGIAPLKPEDSLRAYIKLDGSDLTVLQPGCRIVTADQARQNVRYPTHLLTSIEWFRSKGWLEQSEYNFLKYINQFGVFDYSLRLTKVAALSAGFDVHDFLGQSKALFELMLLKPAEIEIKEFDSIADFSAASSEFAENLPDPIVAIHSKVTGGILVVEGSHEDKVARYSSTVDGAIEYAFGPDRLLFIDLRCQFSERPGALDEKIQVLCPAVILGMDVVA